MVMYWTCEAEQAYGPAGEVKFGPIVVVCWCRCPPERGDPVGRGQPLAVPAAGSVRHDGQSRAAVLTWWTVSGG